MTAIFVPDENLFRATEHAGGPWSPDTLQGSATTALMTREVERLAIASGFAVRRLTFDLWRPAGLRAFALATDMLRDGRKAKTMQVRLLDGEIEIGRCTALLTAQGRESPADLFSTPAGSDAAPETGAPPPAFAQKWSRYFQHVSVRLIEGALERPGPAAAWMRLDVPLVHDEANTPLLQAVQAADFSSGVGQIVDMREWTFINPEISLYFFRPPEGEWILIRSRTRVGANGAGLTMATLSDRRGPFAEVMQAMTFERREAAQAQAS
jgi:Thioesterase-like superfamily